MDRRWSRLGGALIGWLSNSKKPWKCQHTDVRTTCFTDSTTLQHATTCKTVHSIPRSSSSAYRPTFCATLQRARPAPLIELTDAANRDFDA
jgi:hypothetical protein